MSTSCFDRQWVAMFSQTVEYALRAVVFLAGQAPASRTTEQIARATKVPAPYLAKVLQGLVKEGILHTQRGVGGGVSLARPAAELTILEVVNAVDPIQRIRTCPLGLASHGVRLCPLHKRMDRALASVEEAFRSTTLAEVLAEPTESVPLCDFPAMSRRDDAPAAQPT
jgi:Rrf2 family protein